MVGNIEAFRNPGPGIANNGAPQNGGMGDQAAWLGREVLRFSLAAVTPLAQIVRDVSVKTLSTIGPAGISLLWLIPEESYKAELREFDAVDTGAARARGNILAVFFLSSLVSGALTLNSRVFNERNPGIISRYLSVSPKLLAYFVLNQILNFPELGLDRIYTASN